jgi:hypothetical protein
MFRTPGPAQTRRFETSGKLCACSHSSHLLNSTLPFQQPPSLRPDLGEGTVESDIPSKPNRYAASGFVYVGVPLFGGARLLALRCWACWLAGCWWASAKQRLQLPTTHLPLFNGYLHRSPPSADESMIWRLLGRDDSARRR